jgi:hypothetical protein
MDAAALVISSIDEESVGAARLMFKIGDHLVDDIAWVLRFKAASAPIIERSEYMVAIDRLRAAGYRISDGDAHWQQFAGLRSKYASVLNQIADLLLAPPAALARRPFIFAAPSASRPQETGWEVGRARLTTPTASLPPCIMFRSPALRCV